MLHSIFFSLLILFSATVFAMPSPNPADPNPEQVVLKGKGFQLKNGELLNFLNNAYYYPVQKVEVRRMLRNLNFTEPDYIYQRAIRFSIMAREEQRVTCELFIASSEEDDILSIQNCISTKGAVVRGHVKRLSEYTAVFNLFKL